jgi:hypothetical protein
MFKVNIKKLFNPEQLYLIQQYPSLLLGLHIIGKYNRVKLIFDIFLKLFRKIEITLII